MKISTETGNSPERNFRGLPPQNEKKRAHLAGTPVLSCVTVPYAGLLDKAQSLGIGLASIFASAAVDALVGHDADVLTVDNALLDGFGGAFFDALLAEGAQFGIDSIHNWVPPVKFLGSIIVPQFQKNAIQISKKFFG